MDYEKAYKNALEWARQVMKGETGFIRKEVEEVFPELKESEDDRIRKTLLDHFKQNRDEGDYDERWNGLSYDSIITWLEKQGRVDKVSYEIAEKEKREFVGDGFIKCYGDFQDFKEGETYWLEYVGNDNYNVRSDNLLGKTCHITPCQLYTIFKKMTWLEKQGSPILSNSSNIGKDKQKPTDKVEPTFKVGDWIIRSAKGFKHNKYLVTEVKDYYVCEDIKGRRGTFTINDVHKNFKLWDISDANDGDVLTWDNSKCIALFKNIFDEYSFNSYGFVGHYTNIFELGLRYHDIEGVHPATKEQRDLLFKKMRESGYEWDAENKEPRKISQRMVSGEVKDALYDKVSWSEEDERNWQGVIDEIQANKNSAPCYDLETYDRFLNWLRTLKQRLE